MMLRTARDWGAKPTEFLRDWSERDRELAKSLTLHENSICRCGQPAAEAHDPESGVEYEAVDVQCRACAVQEEANEIKNSERGIHWMVVATRPDETTPL